MQVKFKSFATMKVLQSALVLILLTCLTDQIMAQSEVELTMLTDKILLIHVDEGYVLQPKAGEPKNSGEIFVDLLDIPIAEDLNNYMISSPDDAAYGSGESPVSLSRKSKPTEFLDVCQGWELLDYYGVWGCANQEPDHAKEHWLYLELPIALEPGKTYEINIDQAISPDQTEWILKYDENSFLSPAIHVNNLAYSTNAELKYAYVYHWMGDGGKLDLSSYAGNEFRLIDATSGDAVFTGNLTFRKDEMTQETFVDDSDETPNQNFNSAEVYECDFSAYNTPGSYYLVVDGIGRSHEFDLACNGLRPAFELVMKGLYNQRSGIALDHPHTEATRPAPHNPAVTPGFAGQLKYSDVSICDVTDEDASEDDKATWDAGILGDIETAGWYQDAGDWDAYIRHMEVPVELLILLELYGDNFVDGQLQIAESGNGLPDVFDEARWLPRFYYHLKQETEEKGYTTGGVPGGRIFGDLWGYDLGDDDIIRGSWEDTDRIWVVSAPDPIMSYYYAGVAAQIAYLLETNGWTDPEEIDWEQEAIDAYAWANAQYDPDFACHIYEMIWQRSFASAALYRLTENDFYQQDFEQSWDQAGLEFWENVQGEQAYGALIYLMTDADNQDASQRTIVSDKMIQTADFLILDNVDLRACRWGGNHYFPMLVGHGTTPFVAEAVFMSAILQGTDPTKAADYLKYIHTTADYFLGTNPLGMTWITGIGEKSPQGLLHLDSWATGEGEIKAGIVPYGPWRRGGLFNVGPWEHHWPDQNVYPAIEEWPGHERFFEQRPSPLTGEFTINQNSVTAAVVYGALSGDYDCSEVATSSRQIEATISCIEVFPNPVDNYFRIQGDLPSYRLQILDASGTLIQELPNVGTEVNINTELLGNGLFFVKVYDPGNSALCVQKIVKVE